MKPRFLLDENLAPRLKIVVLRLDPTIDILRIGDPTVPATGTLDPDILHYLEATQRILVTDNRRSIPGHLEADWESGGQVWGILWIRPTARLSDVAQSLLTIWAASDAAEWVNRLDWIPL